VNNLDLKKTLKAIRLNESTISMVLGAVVIVVVGILVVNYFRRQETGVTLPTSETQQEETAQTTPKAGETHTVREGDNLWKIAEEAYGSGYNWVDIAKANNLTDPGEISVGQELILPNVQTKTPTLANTSSEEENPEQVQISEGQEAIAGATYTVEKGDNLWEIAVRSYGDGYKWTDIAQENELANPNIIHSGNVLTIPR
jgi:nucleoid-associated protein YgaU